MNHVELVTSTPSDFRTFMSGFPSGVAIVTSLDDAGRPWGMTCSALCSVTVEPPTLLVGMRAESPTLKAVLRSGQFAVNLLHAEGRGTAELFASGDPDRFDATTWRLPPAPADPTSSTTPTRWPTAGSASWSPSEASGWSSARSSGSPSSATRRRCSTGGDSSAPGPPSRASRASPQDAQTTVVEER